MATLSKSSSEKAFARNLPVLISSSFYFSGLVSKSIISNQLKKASKKFKSVNVMNELKARTQKH